MGESFKGKVFSTHILSVEQKEEELLVALEGCFPN